MQVLYRNLMEASYQAALQERPEAVNALCVAVTANPFLVRVYDYLVLKSALLQVRV
jgi:hypothetical protein